MAKKKNQHLVPQVHLRQFATVDRPMHPPDQPVTPFIWLVPKDLVAGSIAKAPRNALVATRAYNMCEDDPDAPWLEDSLARIEGLYGVVLPRLLRGAELDPQDWTVLVLFVATLHARTLSSIEHWQTMFDQLESIHRQVERGSTGKEAVSDQRFSFGTEMSKHHVPERIESYAKVVGEGGWLLRSRSPMEFISADSPVAHQFLHVDDLARLGVPDSWLNNHATRVDRAFVSACSLSPQLMFLSSPLLVPPTESIYRVTANEKTVLGLNELIRAGANAVLISRAPTPYGVLQSSVVALDNLAAKQRTATRYKLNIYMTQSRQLLGATTFAHLLGPHPLESSMHFRTPQITALHVLAADHRVKEIAVYDGDQLIGGMRDAVLTTVALTPNDESIIEQSPLRWRNT